MPRKPRAPLATPQAPLRQIVKYFMIAPIAEAVQALHIADEMVAARIAMPAAGTQAGVRVATEQDRPLPSLTPIVASPPLADRPPRRRRGPGRRTLAAQTAPAATPTAQQALDALSGTTPATPTLVPARRRRGRPLPYAAPATLPGDEVLPPAADLTRVPQGGE